MLLANAEECTFAKRKEACMNGLRIYGFPELKPQLFLNTPIRPSIKHFGTRLRLLTETLTGTLVGF